MASDPLMDDLVKAWIGERIKQANIINQNGANLAYIHGKDIGKKLGLSEDELQGITPFPASTKIYVNEDSESDEETKQPWTRRILPLVLTGVAGLGVGLGAMALRPDTNDVEPPPPVVAPVNPDDETDPNVGFTIR
jgi:hypothetical protein